MFCWLTKNGQERSFLPVPVFVLHTTGAVQIDRCDGLSIPVHA